MTAGVSSTSVLQSVAVSPQTQDVNIDEEPWTTLSCVVVANCDVTIEWTSNVQTGEVLDSGTGLSLDLTQHTVDFAHQEELTCTATLGATTVSDTGAVTTYSELPGIYRDARRNT